MDQVEGAGRWWVEPDVMAEYIEAGGGGEPAGVDVGGEDPTVGSDLAGQPRGDGGAAGADFPDLPAGAQPDRGEVPEGRGVEQF